MIFIEFWNNIKVKNKIILCYALPVVLIVLYAVQIHTVSRNVSRTAESVVQKLKGMGENDAGDNLAAQISEIDVSVSKLGFEALVISLFIGGAFVGGLMLVRSVSKPVFETMCMANKIADGNLDIWIKKVSKDECGQLQSAMKNMADNLKSIVTQITTLSATVSNSSRDVSATTNGISRSIDEQATQIQQSFEATSRVSHTIMNVAKNAVDASDATGESVNMATEGKTVVESTVSSMQNIAENVDKSSKTVEHLGESSKKIGDIIDVINDIAGQTNLLALNAAIEAARAGEQGRGFAVVADEVRKLAEKTSKATDEITDMIKMIQQDTRESIQSMMKNKEEAEAGVNLGEQAKASLDRIVSASDRCKEQVQSITASTEEQSSAIEEVSSISANLTDTFEGSQQAITNIISSTDELAKVSTELKNMVTWFNVGSDSSTHVQNVKARAMENKVSAPGALS